MNLKEAKELVESTRRISPFFKLCAVYCDICKGTETGENNIIVHEDGCKVKEAEAVIEASKNPKKTFKIRDSIGKYRGKILYNGNHYHAGLWVKGFYFKNEHGEAFIKDMEEDYFGNARYEDVQVDPETVGEMSPEKDMDNVSIYEGDKLHLSYGIPPTLAKIDVIFKDGSFMCNCHNAKPEWISLHELCEQEVQKVGTIHDKEKS